MNSGGGEVASRLSLMSDAAVLPGSVSTGSVVGFDDVSLVASPGVLVSAAADALSVSADAAGVAFFVRAPAPLAGVLLDAAPFVAARLAVVSLGAPPFDVPLFVAGPADAAPLDAALFDAVPFCVAVVSAAAPVFVVLFEVARFGVDPADAAFEDEAAVFDAALFDVVLLDAAVLEAVVFDAVDLDAAPPAVAGFAAEEADLEPVDVVRFAAGVVLADVFSPVLPFDAAGLDAVAFDAVVRLPAVVPRGVLAPCDVVRFAGALFAAAASDVACRIVSAADESPVSAEAPLASSRRVSSTVSGWGDTPGESGPDREESS